MTKMTEDDKYWAEAGKAFILLILEVKMKMLTMEIIENG